MEVSSRATQRRGPLVPGLWQFFTRPAVSSLLSPANLEFRREGHEVVVRPYGRAASLRTALPHADHPRVV